MGLDPAKFGDLAARPGATVRGCGPLPAGTPAAGWFDRQFRPDGEAVKDWPEWLKREAGLGCSEAEFQAAVIQYAQARGWRVAHFRKVRVQRADGRTYWETPAAADGAGWVDLVLCKPGRPVLFCELKSAAGRVGAEQKRWHAALRAAGADVRVWKPKDWPDIRETLGA